MQGTSGLVSTQQSVLCILISSCDFVYVEYKSGLQMFAIASKVSQVSSSQKPGTAAMPGIAWNSSMEQQHELLLPHAVGSPVYMYIFVSI